MHRSSILFVYHLLSKANLARFSDRVRTDLLATGRTLGSAAAAREIFSSSTVILHLPITVFSVLDLFQREAEYRTKKHSFT